MKKARLLFALCFLVLIAVLLTSCGGGGAMPAAGNSQVPTEFVLAASDVGLQVMSVSPSTGALTPVHVYPNIEEVRVDPTQQFVFAWSPAYLGAYKLDPSTGDLALMPGSDQTHVWSQMAFLSSTVAVDLDGSTFGTIQLDPATGGWTWLSSQQLEDPNLDSIDPWTHDGIAYLTSASCTPGECWNEVWAAKFDPVAGKLYSSWSMSGSVGVDPAILQFSFVNGYTQDGTRLVTGYGATGYGTGFGVLQRDPVTGALTPLSLRTDLTSAGYGGVAVTQNGIVYVGGVETQTINVMRLESDGSLTSLTSADKAVPYQVGNMLLTPDGHYLLVQDVNRSPRIYVYRIDATTSALSAVQGSPFNAQGTTIRSLEIVGH